MRLDWPSFLWGFLAATGLWLAVMGVNSRLQKRVDRLRWKTLRLAVDAGIPIEQYAKDLEEVEKGR
jgi:hypothetical protein